MDQLTNAAAQREVLGWCLDSCIAKEENTGDHGADAHHVSTSKDVYLGEAGSNKRAKDGTNVGNGVVAPRLCK